jgi:FAD/FMN-containing dehydrogenase
MAAQVTAISESRVDTFREHLRGELLQPGQPGYDAARTVWNAMIDRRPALIARCAGPADVIAAVRFARESDLPISIRGGGHNVAGKAVCDDGLMIDLTPMKGMRVDPQARTARAEPGLLWQEFDREAQAFGLATPGGVVGETGVAGLTLGGGQSWIAGKYGLTIDNLLAVDIVTAGGRLLHASADEHTDLFWAVRGAGHNFGVVTSFEYRLHPLSTVLGGMVVHPLSAAPEVLRFYRDFARSQPDELTTYAGILTAPDGNAIVALVACYVGDAGEGERVLAPLRSFGSPVADTIAPIPYLAMQGMMGPAFPYYRQNYWKSGLTATISDGAIDAIVEYAGRIPSPHTAIVIADLTGAPSRVPNAATAYGHRHLTFDVNMLSSWDDPAANGRNISWTRELYAALQPHLSGGAYVNGLDQDAEAEQVRNAYGENYARLAELKRRYDPDNVFRMNHNIVPAPEGGPG